MMATGANIPCTTHVHKSHFRDTTRFLYCDGMHGAETKAQVLIIGDESQWEDSPIPLWLSATFSSVKWW